MEISIYYYYTMLLNLLCLLNLFKYEVIILSYDNLNCNTSKLYTNTLYMCNMNFLLSLFYVC